VQFEKPPDEIPPSTKFGQLKEGANKANETRENVETFGNAFRDPTNLDGDFDAANTALGMAKVDEKYKRGGEAAAKTKEIGGVLGDTVKFIGGFF